MSHTLGSAALFLATVLAGAPEGIGAQGAVPPALDPQQNFLRLDLDSDGRLSRTEAGRDETLREQFDTLDTDGDGALTPEEYARFSTG